ncbi:MAG: GLUG motif-containing protein [Candidatus Nanoarchaeia archaeon]|nr:GLUG motif-containing protein [Candidatus Nanoarchaeia archaeon]
MVFFSIGSFVVAQEPLTLFLQNMSRESLVQLVMILLDQKEANLEKLNQETKKEEIIKEIEEPVDEIVFGTKENPYQIKSAQDLINLSIDSDLWDDYFIVLNDIQLDKNILFIPIAKNSSFSGDFNGNGKIIDGLCVNISDGEAGLFSHINGASVYDLGVTNVNVVGFDHVGGLVGTITKSGIIRNVYTTGTVKNNGNLYSGGLVGANFGGEIIDSYSTVTVEGYNEVGGLVGQNKGIITTSYSTGNVIGNDTVGGLVGLNHEGTIKSSYSTGTIITNSQNVSELVGNNRNGEIIDSYSTSVIKGIETIEDPETVAKKAKGNIRVHNGNSKSLSLVAGTRFLLNYKDLTYNAKENFIVNDNGYIDIEIEANEPGEEYNLYSTNTFSLPGLKNTEYYDLVWAELLYGEEILIEK